MPRIRNPCVHGRIRCHNLRVIAEAIGWPGPFSGWHRSRMGLTHGPGGGPQGRSFPQDQAGCRGLLAPSGSAVAELLGRRVRPARRDGAQSL